MMDFFELEDLRRIKAVDDRPVAEPADAPPRAAGIAPSGLFARRQQWAELLKTKALRQATK